jgi:hypothetical protein
MLKGPWIRIGCLCFLTSAPFCGISRPLHRAARNSPRTHLLEPSLSASPTLIIPAETMVSVELLSGIQSQVAHPDDVVEARLVKPVSVGGRVALPEGTLLTGRVLQVRQARRLGRPAEIAFRFDQVALPDGQEKPLGAILSGLQGAVVKLDSEGNVLGKRRLASKGIVLGAAGLGTSAAVGAAVAGGSTLLPVVSAGGTAWLAYEFLWHRGMEVNLPPRTRCTLRLEYPLSVKASD